MVPEVGGKKPLIRLKNVVLPAPFGPMIGAQFALRNAERYVAHGHETAEASWWHFLTSSTVMVRPHAALLRRMKPNRPRGKNSTTNTNNSPTNDIQLMVTLDR